MRFVHRAAAAEVTFPVSCLSRALWCIASRSPLKQKSSESSRLIFAHEWGEGQISKSAFFSTFLPAPQTHQPFFFFTSALLPSAPLLEVGVVYLFNLKNLQSPEKPGGTELPSLSMIHIASPQSFPGKENEQTLLMNSLFPRVSYTHILLCILMYHMSCGHKTWLLL